MPLVNVLVNGRAYAVACDDGEEEHLRELGAFLDKRVRELTASVGQVGDSRLILMAGLLVADELSEALAHLEERDRELATLKNLSAAAADTLQESENRIAEALESAASRIEAIAASVGAP